jgi:phage gp45-like
MKIRKGVINYVDGPFNKTQQVQVEGLSGEVDSKVERYQNFGFSSHIVPVEEDGRGAECVIADLGGSDHKIVLATDDKRYRPNGAIAWGDVLLYSIHDTQHAPHDTSTQRFVLTDDDSGGIYRSLLKINSCKYEMTSDGKVTLINGAGCSITMDGTTLVATNGQVTITLNGNQINMSATSVSISATTINLNAQNVNL